RSKVRLEAISKILAQHPSSQIAKDVPLTTSALKQEPLFILGTHFEDDLFSLSFDGLKKVKGQSKLGDFHYVPMLFHDWRQIRKEQRLLLELYGLLLYKLQGAAPSSGIVWHGRECKATTVRLNLDLRRGEQFLED